ncbi:pleckstrin homology domain-containing family S member 1-like [Pelobates fuscus]|uniref:pleckstrin homology domain-containing family S member 1-like n=1 Tax=Pelobates fuscus TaxID=191477 RepID=UPI002FE4648C
MTSRRRSSSTDAEVLKRGLLTKSPGLRMLRNLSSWKARIFKLCKTPDNKYLLNYYVSNASDKAKGCINMSEVKAVEKGLKVLEKIRVVLDMFINFEPENVIYIKYGKRDFYLIDENKKEIEEWFNCISQAWMEITRSTDGDGPAIMHSIPYGVPETGPRPMSYPNNYPQSGHVMTKTLDRQRFHTDPGMTYSPSMNACGQECTGTTTLPSVYNADKWMTLTKEQSLKTPTLPPRLPPSGKISPWETYLQSGLDSDIGSDSESKSDYPQQQSTLQPGYVSDDSANIHESSNQSSDCDSDDENIYEKMNSFCETQDESESEMQEMKNTPANCEKRTLCKLERMDLLKMHFERKDIETINLSVPTEHMRKYLAVETIGKCISVSQWTGPKEIGCLFHHGDDIDTMNDIRLETFELFSQMLNNCTGKEVKLAVIRGKEARVFHAEGCDCNN